MVGRRVASSWSVRCRDCIDGAVRVVGPLDMEVGSSCGGGDVELIWFISGAEWLGGAGDLDL